MNTARADDAGMISLHARNPAGRDFFVGDLHGMFPALERLLARLGFDPAADRVFSVGDLIDRGPHSADYATWLAHPWFHAVRGNHEALALRAARAVVAGDPRAGLALAEWEANGGGWATAHLAPMRAGLAQLAAAIEALPWLCEVDTVLGRVGIVHAQVPGGLDWPGLRTALPADSAAQDAALWARERLERQDARPVPGIAWVVSGHTPLREVQRLGNQWFIDTGACYVTTPGAALTVLEPAPQGWQVHREPTCEAGE